MVKFIYAFLIIFVFHFNSYAQGHYFNVDKEIFTDDNNNSKTNYVKLTYIFDFGNKKIIERNDINNAFEIYKANLINIDTTDKKEIWDFINLDKDSVIVLIDFADVVNHNIVLIYYQKEVLKNNKLEGTKRLWQHVNHYRDFSKEEIEEFYKKLYK